MKKLKYLLPVLSGLVLFSCKNENKGQKDSHVQNTEQRAEEQVGISSFDFAGIQKLTANQSDTIYVTNYWATWCGPCVMEIPHFVELQNEYKDKKVKFIFVNIEPEGDLDKLVKPFVLKHKMENVYQMPAIEMKNFQSFNPDLTRGIPVTIIQKGEKKEGFIGSRDKAFLEGKIQEYSK